MSNRAVKLSVFLIPALALILLAAQMTPASPEAETVTDSETVPISGTVSDCAGNPVALTGEAHILTHTTITPSGHFTTTFHLNQNLRGTSSTGTFQVMNQQLSEVRTGEFDGAPMTQTFIIHSNLNNNDPAVPQLHIVSTFHVTFNANGEITGVQLTSREECQG